MKLYYAPGTCSLAVRIALIEAGIEFESIAVSTKTHQLKDGTNFYTINPLGYVPVLELDNGERLREGPAIVQYIADKAPDKKLAPANGTLERYRLQEWLTFIGTELHKGHTPLFAPNTPAEYKPIVIEKLLKRFGWVNEQLADQDYLMGSFSVADGYLYTVSRWAAMVGVDLSTLENIVTFQERMKARESVQTALKAEGLKA